MVLAYACAPSSVESEGMVCLTAALPAIVVKVQDASNGAFAPFFNVRVIASNSARTDSTKRNAILLEDVQLKRSTLPLLREYPGTYNVTVSADGYQTLHLNNFTTVRNLRCKYNSDTLYARLRKL